jgi:hypothetical protein
MHHLFLDESGDHSLTHIDPGYPVFVLGGILVADDAAPAARFGLIASSRDKILAE